MHVSLRYLTMMNIVKIILIAGSFSLFSVLAASPTHDEGRVDFQGRVRDVSCSIALNGSNNSGSGIIWLDPVSLTDVQQQGAGTFIKPQAITFELSKCQLVYGDKSMAESLLPMVSVRWINGGSTPKIHGKKNEYLENILPNGARHIHLALAINDGKKLGARNKIIPEDPLQNLVKMQEKNEDAGLFTYYIGYVTQEPHLVTSGPISSLATLVLLYN